MLSAADAQAAANALLPDGSNRVTILASMYPQQPDELLAGVVSAARERRVALTLLVADLTGAYRFLDGHARADVQSGRLQLVALAGAVPRDLSDHVGHYPISLWELDRRLGDGSVAFDVFVARVQGEVHAAEVGYGRMVGYTPTALARSARVGFEVAGSAAPSAHAPTIRLDRADVVFAAQSAPPEIAPPRPPTDAVDRIAELVGSLIPHGATLQLGLGTIPAALVPHLLGKRDLGIHSGTLPASLQDLIRAGAATGARKSRDAGVHVATGVLDDGPIGDWGPDLRLEPISVTHAPRLLLEQKRLWAVNSAFEIDLAGLVNAEYVDGARVASAGGQTDFFRAAHLSEGGASVLALPSRASGGRPRIVGRLPADHIAASTSAELDYIVTEHGIAELTGASAHQRAERIVAVAHPDDRAALASAVRLSSR
jgi:acyl-CoA hydrolase